VVLRTRLDGATAWCERRLLARVHRYTLDTLRREIEPVSVADFERFLRAWQHVDDEFRLDGPAGVRAVIDQLAGHEIPAAAWETDVLPARVRGYRSEWLDEVMLTGGATWARLWGAASSPVSRTPIALFPREDLPLWQGLAEGTSRPDPSPLAVSVLAALRDYGALFVPELMRVTRLDRDATDEALGELVAMGRVTCDTFAGLRALLAPGPRPHRPSAGGATGRWSLLRSFGHADAAGSDEEDVSDVAEHLARQLLRRTGVVFRRTLARERLPVPWRDIARACRRLETRGEIRGGRFVAGVDGEQYALAEAIALMRRLRRRPVPLALPELPTPDPLHDLLGRAPNALVSRDGANAPLPPG
jgi:ATP-dependent Lhr-like helicase